eukprot:scaffold38264_cov61-Phaeocystis_antarctica.AAC.7
MSVAGAGVTGLSRLSRLSRLGVGARHHARHLGKEAARHERREDDGAEVVVGPACREARMGGFGTYRLTSAPHAATCLGGCGAPLGWQEQPRPEASRPGRPE